MQIRSSKEESRTKDEIYYISREIIWALAHSNTVFSETVVLSIHASFHYTKMHSRAFHMCFC